MKLPANTEKCGECWIYTGHSAYGWGNRGGFPMLRRTYEKHKGPVPPGHYITQTCGNDRCVNPDHFKAVTGRKAMQVECIHGHPLSGENLYFDKQGRRQCWACKLLRDASHYQRNKTKGT